MNEEKKFWNKTYCQSRSKIKMTLVKLLLIMQKYDCIFDTVERARHFANVAMDSLGIFENNEYKKSLINLIQSSLNRLN